MLPATTEPAATELAPGNSPAAATDEASDRVALFAELQQIRTLAEKYLEQVTKEEKAFEASHSILRVVLQQLQPQGERQPQHADGDEDAGLPPAATRGPAASVRVSSVDVDINRLVRAAEHDAAELVQIIEGIGSEEEFTQMHDESISTILPALCDAVSAELDAELVSLKDVLRKVAAMIMACDNYPDTTRQQFEHWGAMVSPLAEKLEAFGQSRELHALPPPLPCEPGEILKLAAHIKTASRSQPQPQPQPLAPPPPRHVRQQAFTQPQAKRQRHQQTWGSSDTPLWPQQHPQHPQQPRMQGRWN
jgi:hypothetical protein